MLGNASYWKKMDKPFGFTLIELSVVLVIIGLIVGGVLMGRDLIEAANIRSTVTQLEAYQTALNTFRAKYNVLPGDLSEDQAENFEFQPFDRPDNSFVKHNDGIIGHVGYNEIDITEERIFFWMDLSSAGLINFTPPNVDTWNGYSIPDPYTPGGINFAKDFPHSKISSKVYWFISTDGTNVSDVGNERVNGNNFYLGGLDEKAVGGYPGYAGALTPLQAYAIDAKIDDGLPQTGTVLGNGFGTVIHYYDKEIGIPPHLAPVDPNCLTVDVTTSVYHYAGQSNQQNPNCSLSMKM